jgi:hypothetical protein
VVIFSELNELKGKPVRIRKETATDLFYIACRNDTVTKEAKLPSSWRFM